MTKFMDKHKWVKYILLSLFAYLAVLSLAKVSSLHGSDVVYWGGKYFGYNLLPIILYGLIIWLYNRFLSRGNIRLTVFSYIGGGLLALAIVYGAYAHYVNNIFRSTGETFLQIGMVICISMLTTPLVSEQFELIEKANNWYVGREVQEQVKRPTVYFLIVWAIIFASFIPLFLGAWPGNFVFDAKYQMQNVITGDYKTHHPLIHTLLMGKAYEFGVSHGNAAWGYQFYTLLQMLILSSAFAYLLLYFYRKRVPKCIRIVTLLWFTLFPMHALFAISATKDVLCATFFLYFMIFLVQFLFDGEKVSPAFYVKMAISGILLSLFRNNALYAVMAAGIFLLVFCKGWKKKRTILILYCIIFLGTKLVNHGLIEYTDAEESAKYRESFSVPLQCLARVCSYRREDVPQEIYDEVLFYIREDEIPNYTPYLSDAVKNNANEYNLEHNTLNFFKLWVKTGVLFPDEYVESVVTNTMGYWYPLNQGIYASADISLYHTLIGMGEEIKKKSYFPLASALYEKLFWTNDYHYVPILGYLFRNALYFWMTIFYMLWGAYKKQRRALLVGCLPLVYLGTCLLGPMSALRYIYSLVVCVPLLVYIVISSKKEVES